MIVAMIPMETTPTVLCTMLHNIENHRIHIAEIYLIVYFHFQKNVQLEIHIRIVVAYITIVMRIREIATVTVIVKVV